MKRASEGACSFERAIERDGKLIYKSRGSSMLPLIREGRDLLIIEKPRGRLKKYDIPLYRSGGRYVLHRVIKVTPEGYVIRGDNCYTSEHGVTDADVVGVLTALVRGGKELIMSRPRYRLYARLWTVIFPLRRAFAVAANFFGKRKG